MDAQRSQHPGVVEDNLLFAVIHTARQQDDVGVNLPDGFQVGFIQPACRDHLDDGARSQGSLAGCPGSHVLGETVDRHAQAASRRTVDKNLGILEGVTGAGSKICHCLVHAHANISGGNCGCSNSLPQVLKDTLRKQAESIDLGDGRTHFNCQDIPVQVHGSSG